MTEEEKKNDDQNLGSVSGVGVRFGIAPGDYSGNDGVMIGEVFPDLPAAKAGLKEGDKMIMWNETVLTDVESWMPMLSTHKPGDKVTIKYIRKVDGADPEFTTEATLVARRSGPQ
jgi:putative serine protease PepD